VTTSIYGYIQVFLFNVDGTLLGHILPNGETTTTATPTPDEWLNIEALSFNPSGDAVITISPISPFNDIFTVWAIADLLNGESEFVEITEPLITMRTQNDKGTNAYNRTPRMAWLDADRFVSIDDDSNVRVWDIRTGQPDPDFTPWQMVRETGERLTVYDWHLSPIHAHLLVISTDSKARLFDMQTGDVLHIWTAIRDIAYGQSNDEIWLMGAGDDVIRRMVLNNPDVVGDANSASIGALDAHPTEAQYLTSVLGTGGVLQVRDSNTQDILWEINIGEENIITYGVHYSADGTRIIGAVSDGSIRIWDSQTGEEIIRMQNPNIDNQDEITVVPLTVASNLDLTRVATLVYDLRGGDANAPIINIWDLAERRIIHSIDPAGLPDIVGGAMMAYSPDGRYLAGVVTDSVQELGFSEYSSENVRLYFDPMKRLVDEPEDNRYYVVLWDSENDYAPRILGQFDDRSYDLQFLDNATLVTTSQSGDVVFWDVTTGDSRILNNPNDLAGTRTYGFASSPDGRWYAASYTSYIQLWDATTETVVRTIEHPIVSEFTGRWLAFSADSRTLFKGELGVTRYPVTVNDMVTDACQRVYRDFTTQERLVFRLDDNLTCADNPLMTWQYADDESIFVPELTSTADARLLITPSPLPEGVPTVYVYPTPVSNPNASMNLLGSLTPTLEAWQVIGTEDAIMTQAVTATQGYIMTQTATYQPRTTITPSVTPTFTPSPTPIASPTATPSPSATP
jgi:WD40 repeat protein